MEFVGLKELTAVLQLLSGLVHDTYTAVLGSKLSKSVYFSGFALLLKDFDKNFIKSRSVDTVYHMIIAAVCPRIRDQV